MWLFLGEGSNLQFPGGVDCHFLMGPAGSQRVCVWDEKFPPKKLRDTPSISAAVLLCSPPAWGGACLPRAVLWVRSTLRDGSRASAHGFPVPISFHVSCGRRVRVRQIEPATPARPAQRRSCSSVTQRNPLLKLGKSEMLAPCQACLTATNNKGHHN